MLRTHKSIFSTFSTKVYVQRVVIPMTWFTAEEKIPLALLTNRKEKGFLSPRVPITCSVFPLGTEMQATAVQLTQTL